MYETPLTIVGNLVGTPELRFTPNGTPVANFRVASTPRFRDNATGEWKDGSTLFLTCHAWRRLAEHMAESLEQGMRVIVTGRLRQRSYETEGGEKRSAYELEADEVGPALSGATAKVTKVSRSGNGNGNGQAAAADEASGDWPDEPPF
jgi:single-strand DNA-binding protein